MAGKTVLIVEDDNDAQAVIQWTLESAGYRCLFANSLGEASAQLEANTSDIACLILDFFLPDGDGMTFGGQVRTENGGSNLPIIGITAFYTPELREKSLKMGFDACLPKPLDMNNFTSTLKNLIG